VGTPRAQLKAYERRLLEGAGKESQVKSKSNSLPRIRRPTYWPAARRGRRKKARCVCGLSAD
jgi:hypothetical protein